MLGFAPGFAQLAGFGQINVSALRLSAIEPCLFVVRMASNSASGSKLAELEEELKGLKAQKTAILDLSDLGPRDVILLGELNKDLD